MRKHHQQKNKDLADAKSLAEKKKPSLFLLLCILAGLVIILLGKFLVTDKMIFGHDFKLLAYYLNSFARESLVNFKIPFWIPNIFSGMPLLASMNVIMFYPTELLYTFLKIPVEIGFNYDFVLHVFIAGLGMYLFSKSLGLKWRSALFTGIVFMFSGSLITIIYAGHLNTVKAISLIPFFFYFFESGLKYIKVKYFIFAGAILGLQFLSLGMQVLAYTLLFAFFYFIFRIFVGRRDGTVPMTLVNKLPFLKLSFFLIIMVIVSIGISAVQLFPSYEYLKISHRGKASYDFFTSWSLHPIESITFFMPEFFGLKDKTYWGHNLFCLATQYLGIIPLILVFFAIVFMWRNKIILFLSGMSLLTLLLSFGAYTPIYGLLYHIPVFSNFRNPTRFLALFTFSMTLLSGFGLQFLLDNLNKTVSKTKLYVFFRSTLILLLCVALIIIFYITINKDNIISNMQNLNLIKAKFGNDNLNQTVLVLYNLIKKSAIKFFIFLLLSSIFIFLCIAKNTFSKNIALSIAVLIFLVDVWIIDAQFLKTYDIKEAQKDNATKFLLEKDKSLYRIAPLGNLFNKNTYAEYGLQSIGGYHGLPVYGYTNVLEKVGTNNINLLNILNAKYVLTTEPVVHPLFELVYDGSIKIYENKAVLPRVYLAKGKNPESDIDFSKPKITEISEGEVKIISYSNNEITISSNTLNDSVLVLSEIYTPSWKAKVDGIDTSIYPAYGFLRSINLKKGEHKIHFFYDGKIFYIGAIISIVTVILLCVSMGISVIGSRRL